jgi:hypothetical protein
MLRHREKEKVCVGKARNQLLGIAFEAVSVRMRAGAREGHLPCVKNCCYAAATEAGI